MDNTSTFFFFTVIVAWVPVSLVLWWRNMAEYSSPYKVGLIDVGTKFAYQKLTCLARKGSVWNKLIFCALFFFFFYKKVRIFRTHCTSSICPGLNTSAWERYVDFFLFSAFRFLDRLSPFGFFRFFDLTFNLIPDSASKNVKAWYRQHFDSWPSNPCVPSQGTLVCFIRGVMVYGHMLHSSVSLRRQILVGAHPNRYRLHNFCKRPTEFNKKHFVVCVIFLL